MVSYGLKAAKASNSVRAKPTSGLWLESGRSSGYWGRSCSLCAKINQSRRGRMGSKTHASSFEGWICRGKVFPAVNVLKRNGIYEAGWSARPLGQLVRRLHLPIFLGCFSQPSDGISVYSLGLIEYEVFQRLKGSIGHDDAAGSMVVGRAHPDLCVSSIRLRFEVVFGRRFSKSCHRTCMWRA